MGTLVPNVHQKLEWKGLYWQGIRLLHFANLPSLFVLQTITKEYSGTGKSKPI